MNFWQDLPKPFFVMAPMADVTDAAFRYLFAKYSKYGGQDIGTYGEFTPHLHASDGPDVIWTEFVSCDGLWHTREKQGMPDSENPLMRDLLYSEAERPIVAQLFSGKPEMMEYGARLVRELGFDGVDINMGCPDRTIEKQGSGASLIKNPTLARELIDAAKQGARMGEADGIPVSVKTRIGYNRDESDTWLPTLLESGIAALTVHARTRGEMSLVPARWEHVAHAVKLRNEICKKNWTSDVQFKTLIIGNGDVANMRQARERVAETGCDGVMIGRGIFGNPWRYREDIDPDAILPEEKLRVLVEHVELFEKLLPHKNFAIMKKHFKAYVNGWDGAKELRNTLMESNSAEDVERIIRRYLQ